MDSEQLDFRVVLHRISRELMRNDIKQLSLLFKIESKNCDSISLLDRLLRERCFYPNNVRNLIDKLKKIQRNDLAKELEEYQTKIDDGTLIPDESSAYFAGRQVDLSRIERHVTDRDAAAREFRAVYLSGMPGVGKTCLAKEFCVRYTAEHKAARRFINCRGVKSTSSMWLQLIDELNISAQAMNFRLLSMKLKYSDTTLIVLDNVEDVMLHDMENFIDFLTKFINAARGVGKQHCLLVTSRCDLPRKVTEGLMPELLHLRLNVMDREDCQELISLYLGEREWAMTSEEKAKLAGLCGRHPLSMALVASRLRLSRRLTLKMVEEDLRQEPLKTLRQSQELQYLPDEDLQYAEVEKSLRCVFEGLEGEEKKALMRLSVAADNMSNTTLRKLSGSDHDNSEVSKLIEWNLISCENENEERETRTRRSVRNGSVRRYSMHLLTRAFVREYCKLEYCSPELREEFEKAKESLISSYVEEIEDLSKIEYERPKRFQSEFKRNRLNYLAAMGDIYDRLLSSRSDVTKCDAIDKVMLHLSHAPAEHARFYRKYRQSKASDKHALLFHLREADMTRRCGDLNKAKTMFEKIKASIDNRISNESDKQQLRAWYSHYRGRLLMENSSSRESLRESAKSLEEAISSYKNTDTFRDRAYGQKQLAGAYFDLGNSFLKQAGIDDTNRLLKLRDAVQQFELAMKVYRKFHKQIARVAEVHLSLATCEMDIHSYYGTDEHVSNLDSAMKHLNNAEVIDKVNGGIIFGNPEQKGRFCLTRATCLHRKKEYKLAIGDARKATECFKQVYGDHKQIVSTLVFLGQLNLEDTSQPRHNFIALECLKEALDMAKHVGADSRDLDKLEYHLQNVCYALQKNNELDECLRSIEDLRKDIIDITDRSSAGSDVDRNDDQTSSDGDPRDSEDDGSGTPSASLADERSEKLAKLMEKNRCNLRYLSSKFKESEMNEILAALRRTSYVGLSGEQRRTLYERSSRLLMHLLKLDEHPQLVISEMTGPVARRLQGVGVSRDQVIFYLLCLVVAILVVVLIMI